MDNSFEVLYKSLEAKVLKLQQKMIEIKNENVQLQSKLNDQIELNKSMSIQLNECNEKIRLLKDAAVFSMLEKGDTERLQHRIDNLVREIDHCIALMTNE